MHTMKILAAAFLAAAVLPAAAQPTPAQPPKHAPICLKVRDIQDAQSKDGKVMVFKMKDGTIYNNHLRSTCNSLEFGGFAWTVHSDEEVCEDVQTFRTLTVGEICRLGRFDAPIKRTAAK
jgi:hypothetical protein